MNLTLDDIRDDIKTSVELALKEDIGDGDITAQLIPENKKATATIITREDCILCGQAWLEETFAQLGGLDAIEWLAADGDRLKAGDTFVRLEGFARTLLTGERTVLNYIQLLSGVATKARQYADALGDSEIKILDTRKTIPGLRTAQKYAVTVGGCHNHRIGLYDAFLIKENHITACGGITRAIETAQSISNDKVIEVEVESIDELKEAIDAGADITMLDNFSNKDLQEALAMDRGKTKFELSGNLSQKQLEKVRTKRLDYCSFGDLTKTIMAIDLSMIIS